MSKAQASPSSFKDAFYGVTGSFPSTHWTRVRAAAERQEDALASLVKSYQPALLKYLLRPPLQLSVERASEVVQDFITRKLLEKNIIQQAQRERGRFRHFLKTSLKRYAINYFRDHAERAVSLDGEPDSTPSVACQELDVFDVEWARQVISRTLQTMEADCRSDKRDTVWEVFHSRLVIPIFNHSEPESYRSLTKRLGFGTPDATHNALVTGKRRFTRALEAVVSEYQDAPDIQSEIDDLFLAFSPPRARKPNHPGNPPKAPCS